MYKAYVTDGEIYEFLASKSNPLEWIPVKVQSQWYPRVNEEINCLTDGFCQLKCFPVGKITPAKFVPNHYPYILSVHERMQKFFGNDKQILDDWEKFKDFYPQTSDENEFVKTNGLHVPLKDLLFPDSLLPDGAKISQMSSVTYAEYAESVSFIDLELIVPTTIAICLPIVRQKSTKKDRPFLPPRFYLKTQQQEDFANGRISWMDLRKDELSKPLESQELYEDCSKEELRLRLSLRGHEANTKANKPDLVKQ